MLLKKTFSAVIANGDPPGFASPRRAFEYSWHQWAAQVQAYARNSPENSARSIALKVMDHLFAPGARSRRR